MSDQQKVYASVSGALVAHVVLLLVLFFLLSTGSRGSSFRADQAPAPDTPQEVTILMRDLIEEAVLEPPEEELLAPQQTAKPFLSTDLNEAEAERPENPQFESDRNTSAAAELAPDESRPQEDVPTTKGDLPFETLELQKREYVDGALDQPPASAASAAAPATRPAAEAASGSKGSDLINPDDPGEGSEVVEGVDTKPEETEAETMTRPEESRWDGDDEATMARRSFTDPNAARDQVALPPPTDEEDQFAASRPKADAEVGEVADERMEEKTARQEEETETGEAEESPGSETTVSADAGLFAAGFNPEELQTDINGMQETVGQNAVDAEDTPVGRYKHAVRRAISHQWHRYRVQNGDFLTWGILKIECRIDNFGKVHDLEVVKNETNTVVADFSLRAVLDANLPPMPDDVADELGPHGLELDYDFIIY